MTAGRAIVLSALLLSSSASAQPLDAVEAPSAASDAVTEDCAELAEELLAEPRGQVALALAACRERQGRLASAWAAYGEASALLRAEGDDRASDAHAQATALEPRVPKLIIVAAASPGRIAIWRDGTRYGEGLLGVPVAVDPGRHAIEVRAAGHVPFKADVMIAAGQIETVVVPPLERLEDPAERPPSTSGAPRPEASGDDPVFTTAVLLVGSGAALVGAGTILGLVAARDVGAVASDPALCGAAKTCSSDGLDLVERARAEATASTVSLVVGGAAVAAGFAMLLWPRRRGGDVSMVRPLAGPYGGGIEMLVRF